MRPSITASTPFTLSMSLRVAMCSRAALLQRPGVKRSDACRLLLLLNTTQIIDNREDACSHDDFRALLRAEPLPVRQINIVRQVGHGGELISPNWHFTSGERQLFSIRI